MFTQPFPGSAAVAAGLVTRGSCGGPRFRRLFQDVYVAAEIEVDLALRARVAHVLVNGRGDGPAVGRGAARRILRAARRSGRR